MNCKKGMSRQVSDDRDKELSKLFSNPQIMNRSAGKQIKELTAELLSKYIRPFFGKTLSTESISHGRSHCRHGCRHMNDHRMNAGN